MESVIWAQSFAHVQEVCRSCTQLILRAAKAPSICFNEERTTLVGSYRAKEKPFRLKLTIACRSYLIEVTLEFFSISFTGWEDQISAT